MPKITVSIDKQKIYSIAEGISVSIAQHNGGTPTYQQLWASPDEAKKLDIYYREAVSDLERSLAKWLDASSAQFDLSSDADNYCVVLTMSRHWPSNMEGLLANKIQDCLVHAVTAGWLNDFEGLSVKQDYRALAAQDIIDIQNIILLRDFSFEEKERFDDGMEKDDADGLDASARIEDSEKDDADGLDASARIEDSEKDGPLFRPEAAMRHHDNVLRDNSERRAVIPRNMRHHDNAAVDHDDDWTDWGGTGMAYRDRIPQRHCHPIQEAGYGINQKSCRVMHGMGFSKGLKGKGK